MNCAHLLFLLFCSTLTVHLVSGCFGGGSTRTEEEEDNDRRAGHENRPESMKMVADNSVVDDDTANPVAVVDAVNSAAVEDTVGSSAAGAANSAAVEDTVGSSAAHAVHGAADTSKKPTTTTTAAPKSASTEEVDEMPKPAQGILRPAQERASSNAERAEKKKISSVVDNELPRAGEALTTTAMTAAAAGSATKDDEKSQGNEEDLKLDPRFVQTYLQEFGYLRAGWKPKNAENLPNDSEFKSAVQRFQEFVGVRPPTAKMNVAATEQILRKRCANADIVRGENLHAIWQRSTLRWHLAVPNVSRHELANWLPTGLALSDLKELIRQAFSAWEIVISMEFVEETKSGESADILFQIGAANQSAANSAGSGLGVASGTSPEKSRIWLHRDENWSTFQVQEESKIDIFLVLIHEIGHALGLDHSRDKNSVMFPIFERDVGEQLPVISNDDVERLRMLYDPEESVGIPDDIAAPLEQGGGFAKETNAAGAGASPPQPRKCPSALWAATQSLVSGDIYVFLDVNCWRFDADRKLIDGPKPITEMFPDAPPYVDVAISADNLTVLIQERTLYGYTVDARTGKPSKAPGYPKSLHSRVLFYPDGAFPLSNGSVILLRDNVFATYDLRSNEPTMLNDKNIVFPNLPVGLHAGLFAQSSAPTPSGRRADALGDGHFYWMLTTDAATRYNFMAQKALDAQPVAQFFNCAGAVGSAKKSVAPPARPLAQSAAIADRQQQRPQQMRNHKEVENVPQKAAMD